MEIKILGSGGAFGPPVWSCECDICIKAGKNDRKNVRTRPSILVTSKGKSILVDMGPDFREQMLREGIKHLDHVLITHPHKDHTACIYELVKADKVSLECPEPVFRYIQERDDIFEILASRNTQSTVGIFKPKNISSVFVDQIEVNHQKPESKSNVPTFGYLFEENGKKVAYIPDFNEIEDVHKMKNLDVFICDGVFMDPYRGHIGINGGIELYKKLKPKMMIFTHVSHFMAHAELEKYVKQFGNIKVAYDGMVIKV